MPDEITKIENHDDLTKALEQIDRLMNAAPGTEEGFRLDRLATLVEAYENEHFPIALPES